MGGAISLLAVNFIVAQIFAVAFLIIAAKSRSGRPAIWIAACFVVASLSAVFEAVLPFSAFPRLFAIAAFASVLGGFSLLRVGLGLHYDVPVRPALLAAFFIASVIVDLVIYDLPRGTFQHAFFYQMPFFLIQAWSASTIVRSRRQNYADRTLLCLLVLSAIYYLAKIYAAVAAGSGRTAADYVSSPFALISQALGAMLIVGTGLAMLGVMVKDIIDDARASSEIDALSDLYNRRGFVERLAPMLERRGTVNPGALILTDLDHFKQVNDSYGHHAGDEVIRRFSRLLRDLMPSRAVAGRLGGEEFAVFLPLTDLSEARVLAHGIRAAMASMQINGLPEKATVTASFGVAAVAVNEPLELAMQRADKALYAAKAAGRNRVECAEAPADVVKPAVPHWVGRS
ncbi:diguanylate cyclase (GGDEF)-like protein [Sinorhizobium terangae]|uniref:diguanylate cyclase n=1 Tax=Sinorhizobium terangae TaxID=110322 RepID=A0A6N7LIP3_SINTE|nr:GGDEF domain-containing protein [Sinorhizobium terangae]MBB4187424.1 diguanylate cyclase (GGDEF)-like protein [Sinorhizobium terangae]MQX17068.1 diguanylate cyclase [Sinorhizobium terangae]